MAQSPSSRVAPFTQTAHALAEGLRQILQLRRSRWYFRMGQSTSVFYRGAARATSVPDRFYRRALRGLDRASARPGDAARGVTGLALHRTVSTRLAERNLGVRIWHLRVSVLRFASAILIALAILIGSVPQIRRSLMPPDRAAGKTWTASSAGPGFQKIGIMSDPAAAIALFHTLEEASPSVSVDLGTVAAVHEVKIDNRRDCCRDRSLPLALELSVDGIRWRRVGYRRAEFGTWSATFPSTPARFVRVRVDRISILHLRRIQVY